MAQPRLAARMSRIQPFYVMELLARAKALEAQGRSVIHMEVGEPDFATPQPIVEAGHRALAEGRTHYTPALGIDPLRRAIASHYRERFGVDLDPARIAVTPGASGALQLVLSILVNPGEGVLMADPGYPCNRHFVEMLGAEPQAVAVRSETGYQLTADLVARHWTPRTRAALLATPSNPTGTLLAPGELQAVHRWVSAEAGSLIVDEIYQGLVYGTEPHTALSCGDDLFVINSFSKYFGMTGWRLGWCVAPSEYMDALDRLAQNLFLAAPTLSQYAALAAFEPETIGILEERRTEFQRRRDFLLPALRQLGFEVPAPPQGAFYLYAGCGELSQDAFSFARALLEQEAVAVTPGLDFGSNEPNTHIRFAYTTALPKLEEGVRRIGRFLASRTG